jgi:hypothetical protein
LAVRLFGPTAAVQPENFSCRWATLWRCQSRVQNVALIDLISRNELIDLNGPSDFDLHSFKFFIPPGQLQSALIASLKVAIHYCLEPKLLLARNVLVPISLTAQEIPIIYRAVIIERFCYH